MNNNYVGIMAGGAGTRFWPASREQRPKQFLDILGIGKTFLQMTFERFLKVCPKENIFIISNAKYTNLILEQLPEISREQIIEEPVRRNTAPCVAYAAHKIYNLNPNANIVIAPADHYIHQEDVFAEIINATLEYSKNDNQGLYTIGITPTRPDTGYGYIQIGEETSKNIFKVKTFTEKPDLEIAETFLKSGDFLWNSGIFIWSAKSILAAFEHHLPEINELFIEGADKYNSPDEEAFIAEAYAQSKNISIDFGIMEKAEQVFVMPGDFGWSDLGTWGSVYDQLDKDNCNNVAVGNNIMLHNSTGNMVNVPSDKLVVLDDLHDYIVVEADSILLVTPRAKEQQIKQLLAEVKQNKGAKHM